jgi:IS30 family transposase
MKKQKAKPAFIKYLYTQENLSTVQIAKILELHKSTISKHLRKQGISKGVDDPNRDKYGRYIKDGVSYAPYVASNCHRFKNGKASYRKLAFEVYGFKKECVHCQTTEKIQIHHKDKNRNNNKKENLVPVCASCHMKVEHPEIIQAMQEGLKKYREEKRKEKAKKG